MSETLFAHDPHPQPQPGNILRRACGLFVAPVPTFAALRIAPRWLDALMLAIALVSVSTYLFSSSDRGARLLVDRRVVFAEAAGRHVAAADYASLIAREQRGAMFAAVMAGAWLVTVTLVVAVGALAIVSVLSTAGVLHAPLTPTVGFSYALSIAAHASLIPGVAMPSRLLLNLWIESVGPSTSLGILVPFLPEDTFWAHLGNAIDFFGLWWAHTLAIGFAIVYLRRPDGLRLLFLGIYLFVAVALAAIKTLVGAPSF
jgi:hypothetical protein